MSVPERVRLAVERLDVSPADRILEIGCGPGVALSLIAPQLVDGYVVGLDRSAVAINRATVRNSADVASGTVRLYQSALADFTTSERFDKVLAINVNVFWTSTADAELEVVRDCMTPGGALFICYEGPAGETSPRVVTAVTTALAAHGFDCDVETGGILCFRARLADQHA